MTTDTTPDTARCTLPLAALAAVSPFMASKDVRFYLNGMLLQAATGGRADGTPATRLVATDGHALVAVRHEAGEVDRWAGPDTIVPRELVEWALRQKAPTVTVARDGDTVTVTANGLSMSAPRIDGRFPDWQAVMPATRRDYADAGIDADLVGRICKAATAARKASGVRKRHGPAVTLAPVGKHAALFSFEMPTGMAARGVVLPMRESAVPLGIDDVL